MTYALGHHDEVKHSEEGDHKPIRSQTPYALGTLMRGSIREGRVTRIPSGTVSLFSFCPSYLTNLPSRVISSVVQA
jgi:hypothetical protein